MKYFLRTARDRITRQDSRSIYIVQRRSASPVFRCPMSRNPLSLVHEHGYYAPMEGFSLDIRVLERLGTTVDSL